MATVIGLDAADSDAARQCIRRTLQVP